VASVSIYGLDDLALSLADLARLPDDVTDGMLEEGAKVIVREMKKAAPRDTGQLNASIVAGRVKRDKGGKRIYVYPSGTRKNTNAYRSKTGAKPVRNAEVGFILEYGAPRRGLLARQWVWKASEAAADEAVGQAKQVYEKYLKKLNL